ncbi:MAG: carboxypeptidase-like regulatory domain-containing protein, partial [Cyclobacteriaceae bacterium]|nr:carboxypeptidase-like regulatory domain-containing protein [Cyclobacteriaceae bacterium]
LKLQIKSALIAGITYEVLLDFDAARSVVKAGNSGKHNLKPVIRTIVEAQDGAISGIVLPLEATPALFAIQGSDTLASAFTDENGAFLLRGLAPGSYRVSISPATGYLGQSLENVNVDLGQITDVGTVQLSQ